MIEISVADYKAGILSKNKFGAIKTICKQKHRHDSKKEATRCDMLHVLKRGGHITRLKQQVTFVLLKGFTIGKEKIQGIAYRADFTYMEKGKFIIEDVKGQKTDVYLLKKKLLLNKIKNKKNWKFIET